MNSKQNTQEETQYYDSCRFTPRVVCTEWRPDSAARCRRCGWNPEEAARRKKKERAEGLVEDGHGFRRLVLRDDAREETEP